MKCARHTANKVFSTRAAPDFHECMRENVWNVACARPLSPTYQPKCSPCIWNVRMKCKRLREMKCSSGFCCMYVPLVRRVLYIWSDGCSRSTRNKWASSYGSFLPLLQSSNSIPTSRSSPNCSLYLSNPQSIFHCLGQSHANWRNCYWFSLFVRPWSFPRHLSRIFTPFSSWSEIFWSTKQSSFCAYLTRLIIFQDCLHAIQVLCLCNSNSNVLSFSHHLCKITSPAGNDNGSTSIGSSDA